MPSWSQELGQFADPRLPDSDGIRKDYLIPQLKAILRGHQELARIKTS